MADFTQNITCPVRTFGGGGASLWNAYNWNAFNWGEGTVKFVFDVMHVYENSEAITTDFLQKDVTHYLTDTQSVTPSGEYSRHPELTIGAGSVTPTSETTNETLYDGSGYTYVFPSDATNLEDRDEATWTSAAAATSSWTSAAAPITTWS